MSLAELTAKQSIPKVDGTNFTAVHTGKLSDLHQYEIVHPRIGKPRPGKLFLKDHLGLTGMQVSLNKLPAGLSMPFYHSHKQNEELYIFVGGDGQIQIDDQTFDVHEGTAVRISPAGVRTWRNNSSSDLYYIVIQAKEDSLEIDTFDDGVPYEHKVSWRSD